MSFLLTFLVVFLCIGFLGRPRYQDLSVDYNRRHGQFRVKYPPCKELPKGGFSQPFCRDVAEDYAKMFNGTVVPKESA